MSDYEQKQTYLSHVARYRTPYLASHWQFLLKPLGLEYPGQSAALRYRQLEHYRMPLMVYLALDDPTALSRSDFVRLGLLTRPGRATRCRTPSARSRSSKPSSATTGSGRAKANTFPATRG